MSLRRWLAASARTCSESTYSAVRWESDDRGEEGRPLSLEEDVEARRIGRGRTLFAERQRGHIECAWRKTGDRCSCLGRICGVAQGETPRKLTVVWQAPIPDFRASGQSCCDLRNLVVPP